MIRALFFAIIVISWTGYSAIAVAIVGSIRQYADVIYSGIIRSWGKALVRASGSTIKIHGVENIGDNQPYVVISNHLSHMDIPVLLGHIPLNMTAIAKKELFKIPIFSAGMRGAGILKIDRSNRRKAIETLNDAVKVMKGQELSVLAFPEGTRSEDGAMKRFKKGPFMLAIHSQVPILPITVQGTFPILPKGRIHVHPGDIHVQIHPPIETTGLDYSNRDALIEQARMQIASGLETIPQPI